MKNLLFPILVLMLFAISCSKTDRTYDCRYFTISYPGNLKVNNESVDTSSSIVMMLSNSNQTSYVMAMATMNPYGDIESDEAVECLKFRLNALNGITSCEMRDNQRIIINGEELPCAKFVVNGSNDNQSILAYFIVKNGYLFQFMFTLQHPYSLNCSIEEEDKMIESLVFKDFETPTVESALEAEVKMLRSLLPIRIDELTTVTDAKIEDRCLYYYFEVDINQNITLEEDELKENIRPMLQGSVSNEAIELMTKEGYSYGAKYYNNRGNLIGSVKIDLAELRK